MPELVLSNTTTFFSGRLEAVFKKAKKHGIKYLEILPYRWTRPAQVLALEKKYNIQVVGIHLPLWWENPPPAQGLFRAVFNQIMKIYLGSARKSSAFAIAEALSDRAPYLLVHNDLVPQMGIEFEALKRRFNVVLENMPGETTIKEVFDPGHFGKRPELEEVYREARPNIFHISYVHPFPFMHDLPNAGELLTMRKLFAIHAPKYVVIETYPWVSVKKGVALLREMVLNPPLQTFGVEAELPAVDSI